jgi:CubicO group peptidase (beta-lactamase class C family)
MRRNRFFKHQGSNWQEIQGASLLTILFFFFANSSIAQQWTKREDIRRRIDSLCLTQMDTGHFPGLAVAIASGKHKLWSKGYGYADIASNTPVDPEHHLFRIGSISKSITGAAMARLWQKKQIDLDNPIGPYVSSCPPDKSVLTLRQLGGHLGGIRHYRGIEFLSNIRYENVIDPLQIFIHDTLLCVPGTKFNYSTYGWTLISAVMEGKVKRTFTSIIQEEVNAPLKLADLRPDMKDSLAWPRVTFYEWKDGQHVRGPEVDNSNKWAGGGYLCTAEEVARFGYAHVKPGYLKQKTLDEFTTGQHTSDGQDTHYGIGYNDNVDENGRQWIGHSGGSVGGTSMLLIYPEEDLVIVTLVNQSGARMDNLAFRIAELVLENR